MKYNSYLIVVLRQNGIQPNIEYSVMDNYYEKQIKRHILIRTHLPNLGHFSIFVAIGKQTFYMKTFMSLRMGDPHSWNIRVDNSHPNA